MRLIAVYCLTLTMATFVAVPPAAQMTSSFSLDGASPQGRSCASGIDKVDALLDEISDETGSRRAMQELEIARNMMGVADYKGCVTYLDNTMRALKASRVAR